MNFEVERKFKLQSVPPELVVFESNVINQGYLALTENGTEVRIRRYGNKYYETIKGSGKLRRKEIEIEITASQFKQLWPLTIGKRIEKVRHLSKIDDQIIEIDVYKGKLEGLIIAEIEFSSVIESKKFTVPDWIGKEVTNDLNFKNRNLAC